MSAPWFYVDALPPAATVWPLSRDEAKHATGSKRLEAGDAIVLFDGRGRVAEARLGGARGRDGSVDVDVTTNVDRAWTGTRVHLVCALPKGDRLSTLVDMTTQLGVASFAPLRCERSVVGETDARAERIRRVQIEACKQAHWAWLPDLRAETTPQAIAREGGTIVVAHAREGAAEGDAAATLTNPPECTLCIGPEGGFTERELVAFLAAGARILDLASTTLRIETAAVVAVAALRR
ncbi:MAG: RsmE family RNA methyltransferase [Phycisphaerae bacterium]|nr:RsmE family RNA methyltransferase [Phycisphaerae bacterium]